MSDPQNFDRTNTSNVLTPTAPFKRPQSIRWAAIGMWIGAALSAVSVPVVYIEMLAVVAHDNARLEEKYGDNYVPMDSLSEAGIWLSVGIAAVWAAVEIALWIAMALTNRNGFAWARNAATAMGALGLLFAAGNLVLSIAQDNLIAITVAYNVINQALAITIVVLIWRPASTAYYRGRNLERANKIVQQP